MITSRPGRNGKGYTAHQRAFRAGYYGETLENSGVRQTKEALEAFKKGQDRRRASNLLSLSPR